MIIEIQSSNLHLQYSDDSLKEEGLSSGNKLGVPQIQTNPYGPGSVNYSAIRAATVKMNWDTLARDPEAHNHPPAINRNQRLVFRHPWLMNDGSPETRIRLRLVYC